MTTICPHCRPIREHAQANAPLEFKTALALKYRETVDYGDCECRWHEPHRWVMRR